MKLSKYLIGGILLVLTQCVNLPMDDKVAFKAYPNPYSPAAGVLTLEKLDGANFSDTQNLVVVLDFNLQEVYRANILPDTTKNKIVWAGVDSNGNTIAPGVYYIQLMETNATAITGKDSLFKLIVE